MPNIVDCSTPRTRKEWWDILLMICDDAGDLPRDIANHLQATDTSDMSIVSLPHIPND